MPATAVGEPHERDGVRTTILAWTAFLFSFPLLASVTFSAEALVPGMTLVALLTLPVWIGARPRPPPPSAPAGGDDAPTAHPTQVTALAAASAVVAVLYCLPFYTGNDVVTALSNIRGGVSNYMQYQLFFAQNDLAQLSASKLPAIALLACLKCASLFAVYKLAFARPSSRLDRALCIAILVANAVFAAGRGTNFEHFELLVACLAFLAARRDSPLASTRTRVVALVLGAPIALGLAYLFVESINIRSDVYCYTTELCVDDRAALYALSPFMGYLSFLVSGYFGFGIHYLGQIPALLAARGLSGVVPYLVPAVLTDNEGWNDAICGARIDCGVNWEPEVSLLLVTLGIPLCLAALYGLGRLFSGSLAFFRRDRGFAAGLLFYYSMLEFFSLFSGQFIRTSSANVLVLAGAALVLLWRRHVSARRACASDGAHAAVTGSP